MFIDPGIDNHQCYARYDCGRYNFRSAKIDRKYLVGWCPGLWVYGCHMADWHMKMAQELTGIFFGVLGFSFVFRLQKKLILDICVGSEMSDYLQIAVI